VSALRAIAFVLAVALGASGCGGYRERGTLPTLVFQMHGSPDAEGFMRLTELATHLGYHIDFADARYGVFGVHTIAPLPQGVGPATVVVQCYSDGQATVTVLGGMGVPQSDLTRVSDGVRREVVAFERALEAGRAP